MIAIALRLPEADSGLAWLGLIWYWSLRRHICILGTSATKGRDEPRRGETRRSARPERYHSAEAHLHLSLGQRPSQHSSSPNLGRVHIRFTPYNRIHSNLSPNLCDFEKWEKVWEQ